jgi:hypothetical protein
MKCREVGFCECGEAHLPKNESDERLLPARPNLQSTAAAFRIPPSLWGAVGLPMSGYLAFFHPIKGGNLPKMRNFAHAMPRLPSAAVSR